MKTEPYDDAIRERRALLKSPGIGIQREEWEPHQRKGVPPPPLEKPYPEDGILIELKKFEKADFGTVSLAKAIAHRQSRRKYVSEALKLEELSFLLWATQGVNSVDQNRVWTKRTVPSAGARHPFEAYLVINRVEGVEPGVYRYLPLEHKLLLVNSQRPLPEDFGGLLGSSFCGAICSCLRLGGDSLSCRVALRRNSLQGHCS